jgi:hypothetical protein
MEETNAINKAILVAHGSGGREAFSIPKVKTITKADQSLSFEDAKRYMNSSNAWPEYSSTSFKEFGHLSDADCKDLFKLVPEGSGIVSTGLRRGGDMGGPLIYALRGIDITSQDITAFINANNITSLVLLACRS